MGQSPLKKKKRRTRRRDAGPKYVTRTTAGKRRVRLREKLVLLQ